MLKVDDITKSFGSNEILKGITFSVSNGEILTILGRSGAGKTTLLRCLAGLDQPGSGTITVGGEPLHTMTPGRVGLVAQGFFLFENMTVLENIIYAPINVAKKSKTEVEHEALQILERLGLKDKANAHPASLSGGQKQRVAIARSLAMHPDVILYDEPTSALDPEMTSEVSSLIHNVSQRGLGSASSSTRGIASVIVTHDLQLARMVSDKILFLDQGKILELTEAEQFFKAPKTKSAQQFLAGAMILDVGN